MTIYLVLESYDDEAFRLDDGDGDYSGPGYFNTEAGAQAWIDEQVRAREADYKKQMATYEAELSFWQQSEERREKFNEEMRALAESKGLSLPRGALRKIPPYRPRKLVYDYMIMRLDKADEQP